MKCNKCGEDKPSAEFYKGENICKRCKKILRNRRRGVKRALITRCLGKQCVICGGKGTTSHEKFGKRHPDLLNTTFEEIKQNCKSGRFVKVCHSCHQEVHSLRDRGIVDWDIAQHYVREFVKTNPPKDYYPRLWSWEKFLYTKIIPKPLGQQLELPIEVETIKTKRELEVERALKEDSLHHRGIPRYEGSIIDGTFHEVEAEEEDNWEDNLEDDQRIPPVRHHKKTPPLS